VRELLLVLQRAATLATKVRSNGHAALNERNSESTPGPVAGALDEPEDAGPTGAANVAGASGDIGGASGDIAGASGDIAGTGAGIAGTGGGIQPILDGLEELGIVLRDPARGLIDFPAVHLGRQVLLCWQLGEDDIAWWHFPEEGFAGRHPLPLPESW
jgi:hypothetical protein